MEHREGNVNQIYIVDDVAANLLYVNDVLSELNADITVASNGREALQLIQRKIPDLILLDISMPGMDGYEVCRLLKEQEETRKIPVIFLTAKIDSEDIIKGFEMGAVDYIGKPFNAKELLSRVNTHLELGDKQKQLETLNQELENKVVQKTEALQHTNDELQKANDKLTKLDKAKNEFILHVNHELRTPLQGIKGYSRLLENYCHTREQQEYLKGLNLSADRLVKLSEMSLLFTELRTESYITEEENTSIPVVFEELVAKYRNNYKDINFNIDLVPENLSIQFDRNLLVKSLEILIDNALKYSVVRDLVILRAYRKDNNYCIEVEDHGPGFTEKAKSQLFEIFSADNLIHYSHGFGLGLATAKLICDNMGGKVSVFNKEIGAVVRLMLPVTKKGAPKIEAPMEKAY